MCPVSCDTRNVSGGHGQSRPGSRQITSLGLRALSLDDHGESADFVDTTRLLRSQFAAECQKVNIHAC